MKRLLAILLPLLILSGCSESTAPAESSTAPAEPSAEPEKPEQTDDIYIFYTSDVHCGIDENLSLPALKALVEDTRKEHEYTALVDLGDFVSGGTLGSLSSGEIIVNLMNKMGYDMATVGNHEFDYGMPQLKRLIDMAEFPFVAANVRYTGTEGNAFTEIPEYIIKDYGSVRVGFIGILTPYSITTSIPANFMENGEFVYNFYDGGEGKELAEKIQNSVDEMRGNGADYVIALAHLGSIEAIAPYDSISLIHNTTGIDAVLDGHSHSVIVGDMYPNKEGEDVLLSSVGTKMENAGELIIGKDGTLTSMLISEYDREDETVRKAVDDAQEELNGILSEKVGEVPFTLSIKDENGLRLVRNREAPLGNLSADAVREYMGTDACVINGGEVRANIEAGDVTMEDLLNVMPFQSLLSSCYATGQQIIDVLEYSSKETQGLANFDGNPVGEFGGFLQVSGLKYTIDTSIDSPVLQDENKMFAGFEGERRVSDVQILKDGEYVPIDPEAVYTLASIDYVMFQGGDGNSVLAECEPIVEAGPADLVALIEYFKTHDTIPETYKQTEGRITVK
ncbi:MAG: bifunctional metallophosphatase/5'-nucleotidase [Solobacterium sp.]|nr:bifunctional metallophosphatase/5'-nucleotidase [Solobacterium sp.]